MSTETLEFPPIDEVAATPVAIAPMPTALAVVDLAKVDLTDVALAKFGDWKADVDTVRQNLSTLVLDLTTQAKVDEAKSLRHRLIGQPRADVRKVSKALKSKLTAVSKAVGAMEEAAVAAYDDAETLITPQIDKRQAELDAEREAKAKADRERVAGLQAGLDEFQVWIDRCHEAGITAERVKAGMNALSQIELRRDEWAEFYDRAINRRVEVLAKMQAIYESKLIAEHEERRLEEQRAEAARIQALLDARKAELDAQAAELKRQAEEIEAERKSMEARKTSLVPAVTLVNEITQDAQESGSSAGTPAMCASNAAESAEAAPSGDEGPAAHADTSAADPVPVVFYYHAGGVHAAVAPLRFADDGEEDFGVISIDARDPTDAEIAAANGPEVELPPVDEDPDELPEDEGGIDVLLRDCLGLIDVLCEAYAGRFPSHPKQSPEWWADVRLRIENLGPRLLIAVAMKKAGL